MLSLMFVDEAKMVYLPEGPKEPTGDWRFLAACGPPEDPENDPFFPRQNDWRAVRADEAKAKAICETCPVRLPCLETSLKNREPHGVWGGVGATERRKLLGMGRMR